MQDDMITYLIHELNLCIYSLNKYVFSVHMLQYNAKCLIISELPKHPLRVSFSLRYSKLELSVLLQKVLAGHLILLLRMENGSKAPTSVRGGCQP